MLLNNVWKMLCWDTNETFWVSSRLKILALHCKSPPGKRDRLWFQIETKERIIPWNADGRNISLFTNRVPILWIVFGDSVSDVVVITVNHLFDCNEIRPSKASHAIWSLDGSEDLENFQLIAVSSDEASSKIFCNCFKTYQSDRTILQISRPI